METRIDTDGAIERLLMHAGMLMEDFSAECISRLPQDGSERRREVQKLSLGAMAIGALGMAVFILSIVQTADP